MQIGVEARNIGKFIYGGVQTADKLKSEPHRIPTTCCVTTQKHSVLLRSKIVVILQQSVVPINVSIGTVTSVVAVHCCMLLGGRP